LLLFISAKCEQANHLILLISRRNFFPTTFHPFQVNILQIIVVGCVQFKAILNLTFCIFGPLPMRTECSKEAISFSNLDDPPHKFLETGMLHFLKQVQVILNVCSKMFKRKQVLFQIILMNKKSDSHPHQRNEEFHSSFSFTLAMFITISNFLWLTGSRCCGDHYLQLVLF
jgi:hypothetical protein